MAAAVDSQTAIKRVNDTLRGPVADVLSDFLPEIKEIPREQLYERVLDDLGLLRRCFEVFRRERSHFRFIVVDVKYHPVDDDDTPLSCGRSLREVVAMIVRTAAKRYFRRTLAGREAPPPPPPPRGLFGVLRRPQPIEAIPAPLSDAKELYEAIKSYLLHDWQVQLVPTYAEMPPALVRSLGPRLLDFREITQLQRLVHEPGALERLERGEPMEPPPPASPPPAPKPPAAAPPSSSGEPVDLLGNLFTPDGLGLRAEAFTAILLRPDVRAHMPQGVLRISDTLRGVGAMPARMLMAELNLTQAQLVVLLIQAHDTVGADAFYSIFGQPGQKQLVERVITYAKMARIGPDTPLPDCAVFIRKLMAQAAARKGVIQA